jgi:hypothetical protein
MNFKGDLKERWIWQGDTVEAWQNEGQATIFNYRQCRVGICSLESGAAAVGEHGFERWC